MATKKVFYYKVVESKSQRMGGRKETADIYAVKYSKITQLGSVKWKTSSYKGVTSTVYTFLKGKKLVTATEFKKNGGYYSPRNSKVDIQSL